MEQALQGIRVLDFSRFLAGPYCGMLLAMMGAEVIRVEVPGGEIDRELGPFAPNGESMYPWISSCQKLGITLNLRSEKGRVVLSELVKKSDILIEAFLPQAKAAMGLDYESLRQVNPGIIMVSVSGFGQNGPYANRGSFDAIAQGMSGMMSITGFPGTKPVKLGTAAVDCGTGVYGALGAMFALYRRQRTGVGQLVDVSLLDTAVSFMETVFAEFQVLGELRPQIGNRRPFTAPTDMYQARDGYVNMSVSTDAFWRRFTKLIGREDLRDDPRFKSNRVRFKNQAFLNALAGEWVAGKTVAETMNELEKAGIPCGPVYSIPEVLADPQVKARQMVVEVDYPGVGRVPVPGVPTKLSETPGRIDRRAPRVGEDNYDVYARLLGYSVEEIDRLKEEGVI
ncbi:MAG: CoA transferase [Chloroflexi bacterium]|nr:CoA transferase [Chloroflexota bacterium]